jgi:hypothetical protein
VLHRDGKQGLGRAHVTGFRERTAGESKTSKAIVVEAMWRVTVWGIARLFRPRRVDPSA